MKERRRPRTSWASSLKYVEAPDDNAFEPMLRALAQREFDLIIGVGFAQKEAIQKVAAQFPKRHFAIVDSEVEAPNVRSLMFEEHEGAYVIGAIAAMTSKTGKIGFVGGMDIPLIRRFEMGYEAGAKKINPADQGAGQLCRRDERGVEQPAQGQGAGGIAV